MARDKTFLERGGDQGKLAVGSTKNFKDSRKWEAHAKKEKEEIGFP